LEILDMKTSYFSLSKVALAIVSICAASTSFAAAPTAAEIGYVAGASAIQGNLQQALNAICASGSSGRTVSKLRAASASNDNFASYVCATGAVTLANYATATYGNFGPGIPFKEIRINVDQGSFSAIQQVNGVSLAYFNPATGSNFTPAPASINRLGGALDVEPTAFPVETIGTLSIPAGVEALGVGQAFGVAASQKLYNDMFAFQKAATGGATVSKPIPSTCLVTDTSRLECIPTISRGQMATIMADEAGNSANNKGAEFLVGAAGAGQELGYARRVDTSGTQAAAQNYFLGNVCSATAIPVVAQGNGAIGDVPGALLRIYGLGSTGNVRTLLNDNTKYSVGVVSGENNQTGQNWKWLRVQGAALGENATPASAGITNATSVVNGGYDFYFEATYAPFGTAGAAFWSAVKTAIGGLNPPLGVGLIETAQLGSGYNKNGATCQFNSSK
jgi:hypothetical protein